MIRKMKSVDGKNISFETGRMAKQAGGAVLVGEGETVVLVTAVASKEPDYGKDFLPLFVEYREKFFAAGKIPGGFFKREGRPSAKETVSCRLIDRPIRPLFHEHYRHEVQVACSVLSSDQQHQSDVLGITGASLALALSDIPFHTLLSGVRVGVKEGEYILNPTFAEIEECKFELVVAGSDEAVIMVEGGGDEISESVLTEALEFGHEKIKVLNAFQREFLAECKLPDKLDVEPLERNGELERRIREEYTDKIEECISIEGKLEGEKALLELKKDVIERYAEEFPESEGEMKAIIGDIKREVVRKMILVDRKRSDGRAFTDIRDINCEVGVLPRTHGSALFTRGETQSLVVTTLGTASDQQRIDALTGESWKRYMLHYNFPPFSVGEVGFFRGPGRREIGHGQLAERALASVVPPEDVFPYTIRIVSDILESNGSSSMATVCGGSLALMDAGVPVSSSIAGVAMGLIKEGDSYAILTDIQGLEDHIGDMDFKVTGSRGGITAIQMDVKIHGINRAIMEEALDQAHKARMEILDIMDKTISKSRDDISPYAPKIIQLKIDVSKIGEIIGPGGKMVRHIQDTSGAKIDIDDDGTIQISAVDKVAGDKALEMVQAIVEEPEVGKDYNGTVKAIVNFGAFVEILPGKEGLLHISEIENRRVGKVEDVLSLGEEIKVRVIGIDKEGKIRLSRKVLL